MARNLIYEVLEIKPEGFPAFSIYISKKGIVGTAFGEGRIHITKKLEEANFRLGKVSERDLIVRAGEQVKGYFRGERRDFELPLNFALMESDFQRRVLSEVSKIPYGATTAYGEIASRLNTSARAVGNANSRNPLPVIIPCHRVMGKDGNLRGYGGGIRLKEALLKLEQAFML
jgi:methylated-DNA-[protein]-cysteine S-methyltransferase